MSYHINGEMAQAGRSQRISASAAAAARKWRRRRSAKRQLGVFARLAAKAGGEIIGWRKWLMAVCENIDMKKRKHRRLAAAVIGEIRLSVSRKQHRKLIESQ